MAHERVEIGNQVFDRLGMENAKLFTQDIASDIFTCLTPNAILFMTLDF